MNASTNKVAQKLQMTSSGFTLIELMVTIAVLAIIVSIAAPSISTQLANQRVKSTTSTLVNALKEAKAESVIRRQNVTLSYDNSSSPKKIVITASDTNSSVIASYNYNAQSNIKPIATTSITFAPSKRIISIDDITYTICDSNASATSRQIEVDRVANITSRMGGKCS